MNRATLRLLPEDGGSLLVDFDGYVLSQTAPLSVEVDRREYRKLLEPIVEQNDGLLRLRGHLAGTATGERIDVDWTARRVGDQPVWELSMVLRNDGEHPVGITRMDPLALAAGAAWRTHSYRSAWGDEYRAVPAGHAGHDLVLECRSGRSSHGTVPWLGLERGAADANGFGAHDHPAAIVVSPAYSGNWHIHAMVAGAVTAGVSPWQLRVELTPGESVTAPSVVLAVGETLDDISVSMQRAIAADWIPRSEFTDSIPVEWNHWWPYEDQEVDEGVIAENARVAAELGIEIATVDAGWFGTADPTSVWSEQRGDWSSINTARFPSGLEALGQSIRDAGVLPGMWIEAEAVGSHSLLRAAKPEAMAHTVEGRRADPSYRLMTESLDGDDDTFLGYVCMGSPAGREHVLESMSTLITTTGARWIKLDFNIDPDAGCTRTDHGHGAGDGLLRHYEGLYSVLDELRARHPEIMLESCSSGGLRIDLGLARHVHGFFLSDPDYTEHHLQVLHGVRNLLPPVGILHWSWSQWRGDFPPARTDWSALTVDAFDTTLRAAMVHRFGVSLRLPELRPELRERLAVHVRLFQQVLAPLVRDGVLRALTPSPVRGGFGERAPVFQLSAGDAHVVLALVLDGGQRPENVRPQALDVGRTYRVTDLADGAAREVSGRELLESGIPLSGAASVTSWLLHIEPVA